MRRKDAPAWLPRETLAEKERRLYYRRKAWRDYHALAPTVDVQAAESPAGLGQRGVLRTGNGGVRGWALRDVPDEG